MDRTGHRLVACAIALVVMQIATLAPALVAPTIAAAQPAAETPPITDAQMQKIIERLEAQRNLITVNKMISDALGLTKNGETISSRAVTVRERDRDVTHQIQLLPDGKGYLVGNIISNKTDVYWADQKLVLIAALTSVWGTATAGVPVAQAQAGFNKELAYWAIVADAL